MSRRDEIKFRQYLMNTLVYIDPRLPIPAQRRQSLARYFAEEYREIIQRCRGHEEKLAEDFARSHRLGKVEIRDPDDALFLLNRRFISIPYSEFEPMTSRYVREADRNIRDAMLGRPPENLRERYPHVCQGYYDYAGFDYRVVPVPEQLDLF